MLATSNEAVDHQQPYPRSFPGGRSRGPVRGGRVLVGCWAHQGPPKTAQRHKVLADAFELSWISTTMYPRPQLILCLSDPLAARPFLPPARSWAARAFQDLGVTVYVVDLADDLRQRLLQAQRRQYW